ncbi:MAG: metal ABC transporter ATP-binding protein [Vulcanimicrobiota bacterium]
MEKEVKSGEQVMLSFQRADLGYPGNIVIRTLDISLHKGRFYGVVGPNGAGKTTLIKSMLGIIKPLSGRIVHSNNPRFGYVPQRESMDELFPLSVWDIVMMSRFSLVGSFRLPGKADREHVKKALHDVGMECLKDIPFRRLSGGQKQRTLIARALAGEPDMLVLDEPTNGMDLSAEKAIMDVIRGLHRDGFTVVMITHLINLVADCADFIMLLNKGVYFGPREEILTARKLSEAYNIGVNIYNENGRTLIFT